METSSRPAASEPGGPKRIEVLVNAMPVIKDVHEDDLRVCGVWRVLVDSAVPSRHLGNAALDVFHGVVPVKVLDDFRFDAVQIATGEVLPQAADLDGNEYMGRGAVEERLTEQALLVATVEVFAAGEGGSTNCGSAVVAAANQSEVVNLAVTLRWDERLRAVGLSPQARVLQVHEPAPMRAPASTPRPRG